MAKQRPDMSDIAGVRYVGGNDRVITVENFAAVGVDAKQDLTWDASNDHLVPVGDVNADTMDWLAQHPDEFELV